jgi:hypothetical protein
MEDFMNDVAAELESTLAITERLLTISDAASAQRPATGAWSRKEILGHLIDSAANNHQRFVRLQLQEHLELPGYEQDGWVRVQGYRDLPWAEIIELWRIYNRHLSHLIRSVDSKALRHTWNTPDGDEVDLEFVMRDYIVHMKHHLDQILA